MFYDEDIDEDIVVTRYKSSAAFNRLGANIRKIFKGREQQMENLAYMCAQNILNDFMWEQGSVAKDVKGAFWTNRTFLAAQNFFAQAYRVGDNIGFYAYLGSKVVNEKTDYYYAPFLEDYSGVSETLVMRYAKYFFEQMQRVYGGKLE
jgi:hypothetical protein